MENSNICISDCHRKYIENQGQSFNSSAMLKTQRFLEQVAINEQYPLTLWIKYYIEGKFDNPDFDTQVDAGWYDWFCSTSSLAKKLKSLAGKVKDMSRSKLIDPSKCYVFFQNNCPIVGPTYDVFAICDIETERVIYAISKMKKGVYGKDFSGWSIYVTDEAEFYDFDTWKEAKAFLKID